MDELIYIILTFCIIVLLVLFFLSMKSKMEMQKGINRVISELSRIMDDNSEEKVMVFTDHKSVIELIMQVNRLLENRQKLIIDYRKSELASKRMLSNISHDIKTPLTVILGYLEMMSVQPGSETQSLKKVENKTRQVIELINNFFDLAKLEAGDTDISMTKLNVSEICKKSVLDFYDILTDRGFVVEIDIPETDIYIHGDEASLNRIFYNLITNAVRYGYEGNYLGIALHFDERDCYIDIIDKGKGIEEKAIPFIFERLYTLEDSRNKNIQGNGLGLTIAKCLVDKMGGDLTLTSQPFVKTVFTLKMRRINQ